MSNLNGTVSGKGALVDTNNDGVVDGFAHTIKNAGNFNTFSLTNGVLTIQGPSGGSTVGGSDTHVQFNDGGALNGESTMVYNKTSNTLSVSNLTVSDTLTVTTTTTLNSNTVTIGDSIIVLNSDATGTPGATQDAGIEIERGDSANVQLLWDESEDAWDFDGHHLYSVGAVRAAGSGAVYTFTSDTDTGVEHTGTDQLGLLTGGTRVLMVSANGVNIAPAGASGAGSNQALLVDDVHIDTQTVGTSASNKNLILAPHGSGSIELGGVSSNATSISTTVSAHNVVGTSVTIGAGTTTAGTTDNIAGGSLTLAAGQGKGSGAGGSILFKTADGAGSGNSLNALTTKVTILDSGFVGIAQGTPTVPLHVGGDAIITGNLTVSGTTSTVSTTNTFISDSVITLNSGETANGISGNLAGFEIDRGADTGSDNPIARFIFDDSDDEFKAQIETGSGTDNYNPTTLKVGVLKATALSDDDANTMVQVEESADENKIRFDTAGSERMIITEAGNVGIGTSAPGTLMELRGPTGTGAASAGILTLSTAETTIVDGDQLGRINFQAPVEAGGSDSILVGAAIYAEADAEFTNSVNSTELVFATGASEAAVEKMRLTSDGRLGIGTASPSKMLHLVDSAAASPTILIENTGTESGEAEFIFQRTGAAASSQDIGHIKWKALDDGGATHTYGSVFVDAQDETAGTEDGRFIFMVAKGGTDNVEVLRLSGSEGFVWNDQSNDVDFRVESNGVTHMLYVDAGNDKVGIGTNSPGGHLEVNAAASPTIRIREGSEGGYLDLVGYADSQSQIHHRNTSAGENAMLDIDVTSVNSQTQNIRLFRNSNADALGFLQILEPGTSTVKAVVAADTGKIALGTGTTTHSLATLDGSIALKEQAAANTDTAAYGQLWVKTATPNELYFTTDAGNDIQLTSGTSIAGGGGGGTIGIANGEYLGANANVADNDFLRVDGTLIEGRTAAQTLGDIGAMGVTGGTFTGDVDLGNTVTFRAPRAVVEAPAASGNPLTSTIVELDVGQSGMILLGDANSTTIGLPFGANQPGHTVVIINTTAGNITIDRTGLAGSGGHGTAQNLNGAASNGSLPANEAVTLVYIASNAWWGIGL